MDRTGVRYATVTYLAALAAIASLAVGTYVIVDNIVKRQESTALVVNVSGRQRMLLQRTAKLSLQYSASTSQPAQEDVVNHLRSALDELEQGHRLLTEGSPELGVDSLQSDAVRAIYQDPPYHLADQMTAYLALLRQLLAARPDSVRSATPIVVSIETAAGQPLVDALDAVVKQYEHDSEEAIRSLRRTLLSLLSLMLGTIALQALFVFQPLFARLKQSQEELAAAAQTDPLTGCWNRRHLLAMAEMEFERARRYGSLLTALMIDIDHFKVINDTYGHARGDEAIRMLTGVVKQDIRVTDLFGRMGGEEFALFLPETDGDTAMLVAEKLRSRVAAAPIDVDGYRYAMTVSIGVTAMRSDDTAISGMLSRADHALYEAKKAGRNQVCLNGDTFPRGAAPAAFEVSA